MATMEEALDEIDAEILGHATPDTFAYHLVEYAKYVNNKAGAALRGDTEGETAAQARMDFFRTCILEMAAT